MQERKKIVPKKSIDGATFVFLGLVFLLHYHHCCGMLLFKSPLLPLLWHAPVHLTYIIQRHVATWSLPVPTFEACSANFSRLACRIEKHCLYYRSALRKRHADIYSNIFHYCSNTGAHYRGNTDTSAPVGDDCMYGAKSHKRWKMRLGFRTWAINRKEMPQKLILPQKLIFAFLKNLLML